MPNCCFCGWFVRSKYKCVGKSRGKIYYLCEDCILQWRKSGTWKDMPVANNPELNVGDLTLPATEWSMTVGVRGGHAVAGWINRLRDYMQRFTLAGAVALECGGCAGHLHLQPASCRACSVCILS